MFEIEGILGVISLCWIFSLGYHDSGIWNVSEDIAFKRTTRSDKYFRNTTLKLKTILLLNSFWNLPHFRFIRTGQIPFLERGCSVNGCFITNMVAEELEVPVEEYDAVLFYMFDVGYLPLPRKRMSHQRYVFCSLESPQSSSLPTDFKDYFNWTMTYRRDSDIWWTYDSLISRLPSIQEDPGSTNFHLIQPQFDTINSTVLDLSHKRYLAAWFVTHCRSASGREFYVRELANYIPIHIYGPCGNYSCSKYNRSACYHLLERNYKFYLSFENSLCKEYVTEKLFDVIKYNVVPIVYGGANYSEILPPMSYVDVADFSSPQQLANYLLFLDKTPDEYVKYFWWKRYYRFQEPKVICKLCEMLHNSNLPNKVYPDMREWWEGGGICNTHQENIWTREFGLWVPPVKESEHRWHENGMYLNFQNLYSSTASMVMFSLFLVFYL